MRSIRLFAITISAAAVVVMSACGSSTTTPSTAPATSASPSASATVDLPTGPAMVKVGTAGGKEVLTDSRGFALYKFDPDDKDPGKSSCYDECATAWPPLLTKGTPTTGSGADAAMLATTPRKDGSMQVMYNKMPLYYFARDKKPGDVLGQGLRDVWWLVAAPGTPVGKPSAPTSSPTTTS